MSLVVARVVAPGRIQIFADARIVDRRSRLPVPLKDGYAKVLIPRRDLAIAFAGTVGGANQALKALDGDLSIETLSARLAGSAPCRDGDVDFIVASSSRGIERASGGAVHHATAAWVGNAEAFRLLQGFGMGVLGDQAHRQETMRRKDQMGDFYEEAMFHLAFRQLIDETDLDDVGDLAVGATLTSHGFDFEHSGEMSATRPVIMRVGTDWETLPWGDASTGAYGIAKMSAKRAGLETGARFLALHFTPGGIGYLYLPDGLEFPSPIAIRGSVDEFVAACLASHGCVVEGVSHLGGKTAPTAPR